MATARPRKPRSKARAAAVPETEGAREASSGAAVLRPERRWPREGTSAPVSQPPGAAQRQTPVYGRRAPVSLSIIGAGLGLGGIGGLAVVVLALVAGGQGAPSATRLGGAGGAGQPAPGSTSGPSPPGGLIDVGGAISIRETFDALPMDSALPTPWTVTGGGSAAIVALPTSVDRSIQLASGTSGTATAACRPTEVETGSALRVVVDYRLGRRPAQAVPLLSLRAGDVSKLAIVIDQEGAPVGVRLGSAQELVRGGDPPAQASPIPLTSGVSVGWRRLDLTLDPASATATWSVSDSSGAATGRGSAPLTDVGAQSLDIACLFSPEGLPSGWVAIDELTIEGG
jgi:hypothetical protein